MRDSYSNADERDRDAIDALARTLLLALEVHEVWIGIGGDSWWAVRGSATSDRVDRPPSMLHVARDVSLADPLVVAADNAGDATRLAAPEPSPEADPHALRLAVQVRPSADVSILLVASPAADADPSMLRALAEPLADAVTALDGVVLGQLRTALRAREDERHRLARELHDETLQGLGALRILLCSLSARDGSIPVEVRTGLAQAVDLVIGQISGLRRLITRLRPAELDALGLRSSLEALASRTEQQAGIRVRLRVRLQERGVALNPLLPDVELTVYRVVEEALGNAARHAQAGRVGVTVTESGRQVRVEVSDDGTGMVGPPDLGIIGMRERAALLGGRLEIRSKKSDGGRQRSGTTVSMVVPARHVRPARRRHGPSRWTG